MKWILLFALLPVNATTPSQFTVNGYDALEKCERAENIVRRAITDRQLIVWTACLPTNDADLHGR